MPQAPKIELMCLGVLPSQVGNRFLGNRGNGCPRTRMRGLNHGKRLAGTLHQEVRSQRRRRKKFRLKNTFADGDGITRLDEKTSALSLGEALRINLENLIAAGALSSHGYSFRRGDARISTSQRDRLQKIDTLRAVVRHFEAAGSIYLTQNRKAPFCIAEKRDVDLRVDQIIAAVQLCEF